jgi:hypothetical protein
MKLNLEALRTRRGRRFESRYPRHRSSMFYKLAVSETGCISGKFVGKLSPRLGKACSLYMVSPTVDVIPEALRILDIDEALRKTLQIYILSINTQNKRLCSAIACQLKGAFVT